MVHSKMRILSLLLSVTSVIALYPNDFCKLESGETGQCIHILDCPPAQADLKKRKRPVLCGFEGLYTIVCCKLCPPPPVQMPTPHPVIHWAPTSEVPHSTYHLQTRATPSTPMETKTGIFLKWPFLTTTETVGRTDSSITTTESTPSSKSLRNEEPPTEENVTPSTSITEGDPFTSPLDITQPVGETEQSIITTTNPSSSSNGDISERKCQEYLNTVIPTTPLPFLLAKLKKFVVGGVRAVPKEFPHMAALGYGDSGQFAWQCGGSLISEQFILTAAHCLFSRSLGDVRTVRLGDLNIFDTRESTARQEFNVTESYSHPNYNSSSHYNDIALLKIDRPVTLTEYVSPACLQKDFEVNENEQLSTTGWGAEEFGGSTQSFLQKADLFNLHANNCVSTYGPQRMLDRGFDTSTQICGGNLEKRVDTCQGDSGGPLQRLIIRERLSYRIVGVTSFGKNCGIVPGIYTRVSSYIPWIESIVWKD